MPLFALYKPNNFGSSAIPRPDNAPTNSGSGGKFDFSPDHIRGLLLKAKAEQSRWTKVKSPLRTVVVSGGTFATETLLHVSGIGMIVNLVQHGASAASTESHLTELGRINPEKCHKKCRKCDELLGYVYGQKDKKLDRRMMKMAPGLAYVEHGRAKLHALGKKNRGAKREMYACMLWIAAKDGCPVAKAILDELFCGIDGLMKVVAAYSGILAIAEKLKST